MSDGGISHSSLLERTAAEEERERNAPRDALQGEYLLGKYLYAFLLNIVPLLVLSILSIFKVHIPDVTWIYKNTSGVLHMFEISVAVPAFYASLHSRQARLLPIFGVAILAMAAALATGYSLKIPLDGFAVVNAEIVFVGATAAIAFFGRFVVQLAKAHGSLGRWARNVGSALIYSAVSASACSGVQDYPPNLVVVAAGVLTGVALLFMPAMDGQTGRPPVAGEG